MNTVACLCGTFPAEFLTAKGMKNCEAAAQTHFNTAYFILIAGFVDDGSNFLCYHAEGDGEP
ncbi:hypothetical protein SAMN05216299_106127 [Nitrosospira sp. Nsp14]|nr:hypothetical protein SAMN05216299_106127 [Nitrosospira sp. Nsp14]